MGPAVKFTNFDLMKLMLFLLTNCSRLARRTSVNPLLFGNIQDQLSESGFKV